MPQWWCIFGIVKVNAVRDGALFVLPDRCANIREEQI
jgi:hypothetical protein